MQKLSADNLLEALRNGHEGPVDGELTFDVLALGGVPPALGAHPLPQAALEALNNEHARLLDAALNLLEAVGDDTFDQAVLRNHQSTTPVQQISNDIPISALQADELFGSGFAAALPWNAFSVPNSSNGDGQTGSEDTNQVLRGGSSRRAQGGAPLEPTSHQRPRRQTAQQALRKLTVLEAAASLDKDISWEHRKQEQEDQEDCEEDDSDDGFGSNGPRQGTSAYPGAQLAQKHYGTRRSGQKPVGRSLQQKPYDGLVDPDLPPEEVRRIRRVLSNRESARRSRKRKATQISALEDELAEARTAAGDLECELVRAVRTVQGLETERNQLMDEVERLKRKLTTYEEQSTAVVPALGLVATSSPPQLQPAMVPSRSSAHFQSPLRQLGFQSQVSHRVRFQPAPAPTFFLEDGV